MTFLQSCYLKSINHDIKARKAYTLKNIVAKRPNLIKSRQGNFALNRERKDAKRKCNALKNKRHNEITSSGQE